MNRHVHTEVKCHDCSRVCGEIEGQRPPVWVLSRVGRIIPVVGCSVESSLNLRCGRCGGRVYPDESYEQVVDVRSPIGELGYEVTEASEAAAV